MSLVYGLQAKNDNGIMRLYFNNNEHGDGEVAVSLTGTHKGEDIQIDFDPISEEDAKVLAMLFTR